MAGVRSPYFDPAPVPWPPVVMWRSCPIALKLFALNSKDTFHSALRVGKVVREVFRDIDRASFMEKTVSQESAINYKKERAPILLYTSSEIQFLTDKHTGNPDLNL